MFLGSKWFKGKRSILCEFQKLAYLPVFVSTAFRRCQASWDPLRWLRWSWKELTGLCSGFYLLLIPSIVLETAIEGTALSTFLTFLQTMSRRHHHYIHTLTHIHTQNQYAYMQTYWHNLSFFASSSLIPRRLIISAHMLTFMHGYFLSHPKVGSSGPFGMREREKETERKDSTE